MRAAADPERIRMLARELARIAKGPTRMYLTAGLEVKLERALER